jgi:hypothetical protein
MLKLKNNVYSFLLKNINNLSFDKSQMKLISTINSKKPIKSDSNYIIRLNYKSFCDKNFKNENQNNDPDIKRYNYDYEAPENLDFEYKSKLQTALKFLFSLSLFSFGFYMFFLRKINLTTKKHQFYFLNEYLELKIASYVSNKIQKIYAHYIYKHESENAQYALEIYKTLLNKNQILNQNKISKENIFIIESEVLGCFMLKNGDIFVSSRLIDVCVSNPNHLAFYLSCEIAFQAMGLDSGRILNIVFDLLNSKDSMIRNRDSEDQELPKFSLADNKKKELEFYNKFLLFYPESVVLNYLEEKEVLKIALRILHRANFNVYEAIEIMKFFDEKMLFYPHKYRETNKNLRFRYYDILINLVNVFKINQK